MTFDFGERLGIFLIVEAASLSTIAVCALLVYAGYKRFWKYLARRYRKAGDSQWIIPVADPSDSTYFLNLMVAELILALGNVLNIRWIADASVTQGAYCTAQGVLKQAGDVGVALSSLTIALHTFSVLVIRWRAPSWVSTASVLLIWGFIFLLIVPSASIHGSSYYADTGYWCWMGEDYRNERIFLEYFWMWLSAGIMLLIYGAIFLVMRGMLVLEPGPSVHFNFRRRRHRVSDDLSAAKDDEERDSKRIAKMMLYYPLVYIICIIPQSIVRWITFTSSKPIPHGAIVFSSVLFSLSGLFNAILYKQTRPDVVSGRRRRIFTLGLPGSEKDVSPDSRRESGEGHLPDDVESLPDVDEDRVSVPDVEQAPKRNT